MVSACMHAKGQLLLIRIEAPSTYLGQFGTERRVELVRRVERAQVVGGEFRQPVLVGDVLGERAVAGVREGRLVHGFERREASLMLHLWGIAAERGRAVVSACMQGQGRAEALRVAERSIKVRQGPSRSNVNQWQSEAIDETHLLRTLEQ